VDRGTIHKPLYHFRCTIFSDTFMCCFFVLFHIPSLLIYDRGLTFESTYDPIVEVGIPFDCFWLWYSYSKGRSARSDVCGLGVC
jgi:hypothetical protein